MIVFYYKLELVKLWTFRDIGSGGKNKGIFMFVFPTNHGPDKGVYAKQSLQMTPHNYLHPMSLTLGELK